MNTIVTKLNSALNMLTTKNQVIQVNGLISGIVAHSIKSPIISSVRTVAVEILDKLGIKYDVRFRPHASILKLGPTETKELMKTCNIKPSQELLQTMELR